MVKVITPQELDEKGPNIPDEVIEVFNELISKNYRNGSATIKNKEIVPLIASRLNISTNLVYENHYLDVESIFRKVGWIVKYEQATYGDSDFDAYFKFSKKA